MSTQSVQDYDPDLGLTIPPAIESLGRADGLISFAKRAERIFREIGGEKVPAAAYALTNAHRRRVLLTTNLRELYHIVRLREDTHAQWDIRNIAQQMSELAEEVVPLSAILLCGKDQYVEKYRGVFVVDPAVKPPE